MADQEMIEEKIAEALGLEKAAQNAVVQPDVSCKISKWGKNQWRSIWYVFPINAMQAFGQTNTTNNNTNLSSSTGDNEIDDLQNDQIDPTVAATAKVQPEQAKSTAVSNTSADSDVKSVQLEDENGSLGYSVVILKDNTGHTKSN